MSASHLTPALQSWLRTHAAALHESDAQGDALLEQLGRAGLFGIAVPTALGGGGQVPH